MTDFATNQQSQSANPPLTQSVPHEPYTNTNPVPTNLPPATTGFDQPNPVRPLPTSNSSGGEPTKVPNLQSNMFKMQRNRSNYRLPFKLKRFIFSFCHCFFAIFSAQKELCRRIQSVWCTGKTYRTNNGTDSASAINTTEWLLRSWASVGSW